MQTTRVTLSISLAAILVAAVASTSIFLLFKIHTDRNQLEKEVKN